MTFRNSILLAWAIHFFSVTFASPPPSNACCDTGQGLINTPEKGTWIQPGQSFEFSYTPRNAYYTAQKAWSSYHISVALLTSWSGPTYLQQDFVSQMLSGSDSATGYAFGRFPSGPGQNLNMTLVMPDFSQPPWNSGPASSQQVFLGVLEEWTQVETYGKPIFGKQLSFTYHWLTYNLTNPVPFVCPTGSVTRADQTACQCRFCNYKNVAVADEDTFLFAQRRLDESSCRELCDLAKDCYAYRYNTTGALLDTPDLESCLLYSTTSTSLVPKPGFDVGIIDKSCKDGCYQAYFNGSN